MKKINGEINVFVVNGVYFLKLLFKFVLGDCLCIVDLLLCVMLVYYFFCYFKLFVIVGCGIIM